MDASHQPQGLRMNNPNGIGYLSQGLFDQKGELPLVGMG